MSAKPKPTDQKSRVGVVRDDSLAQDLDDINNYGDPERKPHIDLTSVYKIEQMIERAVKMALNADIGDLLYELSQKHNRPLVVLVKPNLTWPAPPIELSTTDPRVVQALCRFLKRKAPADTIFYVADNTSFGPLGITREAFELSGIQEAIIAAGLSEESIIPLDEEEAKGECRVILTDKFTDQGLERFLALRSIRTFNKVLDADFRITVPKLKTQLDEVVSLGLKSWQGILPHDLLNRRGADSTIGLQDNMAQQGHHRADLSMKIVDLHRIVPCNLVIVDGLWGMEGQGPWEGKPVKMDLIIAGTDVVAVDATATRCMGIDPMDEIVHIRLAHAMGLGTADETKIQTLGTPVEECVKHFKRPNWNPVGYVPEVKVYVGGTCIGCMATVRAFLDTLRRKDQDSNDEFSFQKLQRVAGEVHIIAGLDVPITTEMLDGLILLIGDCPFLKSDVISSYKESLASGLTSTLTIA